MIHEEPIFKSIFGEAWASLPLVFHKHYALRPYGEDNVMAQGALDVMCKQPIKFLRPIMELMGQIPMRNEKNVPVTVYFESDRDTSAFHFKRIFYFGNNKPYIFQSRMMQIKGSEVVEIMRFGLCWKILYSWDGQKIIMHHRGYALYLLGFFIPMPLTVLIGRGYAQENAVDDNTFDMITHITHPWWGKIYEYKGRFKIAEEGSK